MVLSDVDIRRMVGSHRLKIEPFDSSCIQPASIDIKLGRKFRVFHNALHAFIDPRQSMEDLTDLVEVHDDEPFMLYPGEFVLGRSVEVVGLPVDIVARLEGKSSLGRLGLLIHSTAGFIDPGFSGTVTLELSNVANLPIALYPGMPIGQLSFMRMESPAVNPYGSKKAGSKYQGQVDPTASRFHMNFERDDGSDAAN